MNLFFQLDQYCLVFATLLIRMIYMRACRYLNPSSEVKLKFICEHKALLQLIRSVYIPLILFQALSKTVNRN